MLSLQTDLKQLAVLWIRCAVVGGDDQEKEADQLRSGMYFSLCVQRRDGDALVKVEGNIIRLAAQALSAAEAIAAPQSTLGA